MSDLENTNTGEDLCANETLRDLAIDHFESIFRVGDDPNLFYFFPAGELLRLLSEEKVIGIKVHPALVDKKNEKKIEMTMVLKSVKYTDKQFIDFVKDRNDEKQVVNSRPTGTGSAACCPTPGIPKKLGLEESPDIVRKAKIQKWIDNLIFLRDQL